MSTDNQLQVQLLPVVHAPAQLTQLDKLVTDTLAEFAPATRRVYATHLRAFLSSSLPLTREGLQQWVGKAKAAGRSASAINQSLSAIKRLAAEAWERGLMTAGEWAALNNVKRQQQLGIRSGNWLEAAEVVTVLRSCESKRDLALLSLLLGCGLRRSEAANLHLHHLQHREGRMVIMDLVGKKNRTRSVTVPSWAESALLDFIDSRQLVTEDRLFNLTESGVWWVVKQVMVQALGKRGRTIAPHDLRRTYARLSVDGGVDLRQLQAELGHSSVQTTERYVGKGQSFKIGKGAGDCIKIKL